MKLEFSSSPFLSLNDQTNLAGFDLPQFTVLTGINGSGKSHILSAIKSGELRLGNIDPDNALLLRFQDLINAEARDLDAPKKTHTGSLKFLEEKASSGKTYKQTISEIYRKYLTVITAETRHLVLEEIPEGALVWEIRQEQVSSDLWGKIEQFKTEFEERLFQDPEFIKLPLHQNIAESYRRFGKVDGQKGFHLGGFVDVIDNQTLEHLTAIYKRYVVGQEAYALSMFHEDSPLRKTELLDQYRKQNPEPWMLVDETLAEVRTLFPDQNVFNFTISNPTMGRWETDKHVAVLMLPDEESDVAYQDLSSGEQAIFALLMYAIESKRGNLPPPLLLLDEVDATLHPSMIKAMLHVIKDVFLERGSAVILATHSPTMVSLVDEEAIFVVQRGDGEDKIAKTSRSEALSVLTEGYASFDDLLKIGTTAKDMVVISEGKNHRYIRKAIELFGLTDEAEVLDVNVGSSGQLRTLFDLIRKLNNTKKFVFVWDWDYRTVQRRDKDGIVQKDGDGNTLYDPKDRSDIEKDSNEYNRGFIFDEYNNSDSKRGIENLFDKEDTKDFQGGFGRNGPNNKKTFERFILDREARDVFENFGPLMDLIKEGKK